MSRKMVGTFETSAAQRNWEQKFKILAHQHMKRGIQLSTGAQESSRELWNPRGANPVASVHVWTEREMQVLGEWAEGSFVSKTNAAPD